MKDRRERRVSRGVWRFAHFSVFLLFFIPLGYFALELPSRAFAGQGFGLFELSWIFVISMYGAGARRATDDVVGWILGPRDADPTPMSIDDDQRRN